jgi:beta-galactosidase
MKSIQKIHSFALAALVGVPLAVGCSSSSPGTGNIAGVQAGGAGAGGTPVSPGGTTSAAGQMDTGGIPIPTAGSTGGSISSGGDTLAGGAGASGGDTVVGGSLAGGTVAKGGSIVSGGNTVGGGSTSVPGGTTKAGGSVAPAGTTAAGGTAPGGTTTASGGVVTGGATGGGGVTVLPPLTGRVRTIMPLDKSWLFNKGDASGADGATFADSGWKPVNLPHDWAIEGPFDSGAATTGRGAYVPSGIGWYRNHFTLPASVTSGQQVYVEFDGVMGNSTAYINGTQLGNHPYGYVSFRYDMTKSIKVGTENVIAVKTDTSIAAGIAFLRGRWHLPPRPRHRDRSGSHRSVRHLRPDALADNHIGDRPRYDHGGQFGHDVSKRGRAGHRQRRHRDGAASGTAAAQTIAAGASASFTFDIPVASPKLWSLETPNMYQLLTNVQVGGKAVDDDVTPFGIRDLKFSTGMTLNGKSQKFKGVCLHQDYHGLGLAAPARAMQRRLAALKAIGANAIRTAHDPPSPQFLDLCDRMGFLVLDEFTDVWTAHKYQDSGDYATYFNKASTTPTGMPALPSAATSTKWWEVDFTGWIMRDRNHPSVALYSMGNEIHDSINTRTPILTEMVKISHALDPSRYDTQALLDPGTSGDVGGATNTLLDVWGTNYNTAVAISAAAATITKSGLLTEKGADTSTWTSDVMGNAALTGEFIWTGVDYLGEVNGGWPSMGGNGALLDELGTPRSGGVTWSGLWGGP